MELSSSLQDSFPENVPLSNKVKTFEDVHSRCGSEKFTLSTKVVKLTMDEKKLYEEVEGLWQSYTNMTLSHHTK